MITVLAALRPALRATRVPPIAAVREGARAAALALRPLRPRRRGHVVRRGRSHAHRPVRRSASPRPAAARDRDRRGRRCSSASRCSRRSSCRRSLRVLGAGRRRRLGGAAGKLARANVDPQPARTASTASALMIGLALVTLVGVLAAGLRTRFEASVNQVFVANYALTATNNFSPIGVASSRRCRCAGRRRPSQACAPAHGRAFGSTDQRDGRRSRTSARSSRSRGNTGGPQTPARLGTDGAFVSKDYATSHHLHVGSPIAVETPTGATLQLSIRGDLLAAEGRTRRTAT